MHIHTLIQRKHTTISLPRVFDVLPWNQKRTVDHLRRWSVRTETDGRPTFERRDPSLRLLFIVSAQLYAESHVIRSSHASHVCTTRISTKTAVLERISSRKRTKCYGMTRSDASPANKREPDFRSGDRRDRHTVPIRPASLTVDQSFFTNVDVILILPRIRLLVPTRYRLENFWIYRWVFRNNNNLLVTTRTHVFRLKIDALKIHRISDFSRLVYNEKFINTIEE